MSKAAKIFHVAMIAAGVGFLALLIRHVGVSVLWSDMKAFGWGLVAFVALEGVADVFHAAATQLCFARGHRKTPFWALWSIRISGAAINYLTPTVSVGGEVTKVTLLERYVPRTEAAAAIVIDKLSWTVAQLGLASLGTAVLLGWIPLDRRVSIPMFAASALIGLGCAGFLIFQIKGWLGPAIRRVFGRRASEWMQKHLGDVDASLVKYYREQPWDLPLSIFWHVLGFGCGIVQAWLFLWYVLGQGSWMNASAIWMVATIVDVAAFAVPAGLGTQEGARMLIFGVLGLRIAEGLSFGLALRVEQIFFAALGLLLYPLLIPRKAPAAVPEPEPVRARD